MAQRGRPRKPKMDWFVSLRGATSAERKEEWIKLMTDVAKVFEKAARGHGAQVLAMQDEISVEEAVRRFLWPRGDELYWSLRLAGKWKLLEGDKSASISEIRKKMTVLENAYESLALTMCDRAVNHCDYEDAERPTIEEEFRLLGFFDDEIKSLLSEPRIAVDCLNKIITDIRGWMDIYPANGRGSLASIIVAELVAAFFEEADAAAEAANDIQTRKLLRVKFARKGTIPANSYCLAVESALIALEVWSSPTAGCPKGVLGGGWPRAVQDVCALRGTPRATYDSGSNPQ